MFTGLVEEVGECLWLRRTTEATQLTLTAPKVARDAHRGDSISINGCCLTITSHRKDQLSFDLLEESLRRTNIGRLRPGSKVNLERAVAVGGRMGGHFVQGHVDGVSEVLSTTTEGKDLRLEIRLPDEFARYVVWKGSICVNGVSLTVATLNPTSFVLWIIPHTASHTNLRHLEVGDLVNLEYDILAKYTERILSQTAQK
jgi:riboflavin synthase